MKKTIVFLTSVLFILSSGHLFSQVIDYKGGETIKLSDGTTVRGIISKYENQKVYIATSQKGATAIQRGEKGPGVVVADISKISFIEWGGRDDRLKKRVQEALEAFQNDQYIYEKTSLLGNIDITRWKQTYSMSGYEDSETDKTIKFQFGPAYTLRRERPLDGDYVEGRLYFDYDNQATDKKTSIVLSGINRFEGAKQQEVDTSTTSAMPAVSPEEIIGLATSITDYSIMGYKHYIGGTPYFWFGEAQIGYDRRKASAEATDYSGEGNGVPDIRFYVGGGWGKIFNIAGSTRAKTIEKELMKDKVINKPLTRQMQRDIETLFEQTNNPGVQTREIFQLLRNRGYIAKEPNLEQSFSVMQMIEDSFTYRLEGLEMKWGVLSHVFHQADNPLTDTEEGKIDPSLDLGCYLRYYKPITNEIQFTQEGVFVHHMTPSPVMTTIFSNTSLDNKLNRNFLLTAYNLLILMMQDYDPGNKIMIDEIGCKGNYYIAERVSINTKIYAQYLTFGMEIGGSSFEFKYQQIGFTSGIEYAL